MNFQKAWIIAQKDLELFWQKKSILYSVIIFPLIVAILMPLVIKFAGGKSGGIPAAGIPVLLNAFSFFFVIGAATLPTAIAAYSLVGEKIEKSLEPLLATPTSDGEIFFGKSLAAFLPPIISIWIGSIIFMFLIDKITFPTLGYLFYPNLSIGIVLLLITPLTALFAVEASVLISSRVSDVRAAQQFSGLLVLPFAGIYVGGEIGIISLEPLGLITIAAVIMLADIILFFLSKRTFQREEILTRWK